MQDLLVGRCDQGCWSELQIGSRREAEVQQNGVRQREELHNGCWRTAHCQREELTGWRVNTNTNIIESASVL